MSLKKEETHCPRSTRFSAPPSKISTPATQRQAYWISKEQWAEAHRENCKPPSVGKAQQQTSWDKKRERRVGSASLRVIASRENSNNSKSATKYWAGWTNCLAHKSLCSYPCSCGSLSLCQATKPWAEFPPPCRTGAAALLAAGPRTGARGRGWETEQDPHGKPRTCRYLHAEKLPPSNLSCLKTWG